MAPPSPFQQQLAELRRALSQGEHPAPVVLAELPDLPASWDDASGMEEHLPLAEAVAARPLPVVAIATPEGQDAARALLATRLARLLAERGEELLLVDCVTGAPLARACGREEDEEGLSDLAEYGASIEATAHPTPVAGVQLMGPGSWAADALAGTGLDQAMGRLVERFDRVLVAVAVGDDASRVPMLGRAQLAVFGHPAEAGSGLELVRQLRSVGAEVAGAVLYAPAGSATDVLVDNTLHSRAVTPLEVDPPGEHAAAPGPAPDPLEAELPPSPRTGIEGGAPSSPLFRRVTLVLAVLLVAFLGWWGFTTLQRGLPGSGTDGGSEVARRLAEESRQRQEAASPGPGRGAIGATIGAVVGGADSAVAGRAAAGAAPADTMSEGNPPADPAAGEAVEAPAPADPAPVEAAPAPVPADDTRDALLAAPVEGRYTLHLWSFSNAADAERSSAALRRDGYAPATRAVELPGKGTWYRVYVGNFGGRDQAATARELVLGRRDVDYASPQRY